MKKLKTKRNYKFLIIIQLMMLGLFSCTTNSTEVSEKPSDAVNHTPPISVIQQTRPAFVEETSPKEFDSIPLSLFNADLTETYLEETGVYILSHLGHPDIGYKSSVCLEVESGGLAQPGDDFFEFETFIERTTLSVNDKPLPEISGGHINLTLTDVEDKNGETIVRGVGPAVICGKVILDVGLHNVRFEFEQASGDIQSYTWQFELTEE